MNKPLPPVQIQPGGGELELREVPSRRELSAGTWHRKGNEFVTLCIDLPLGASAVRFAG
jgi:hypothetical protein